MEDVERGIDIATPNVIPEYPLYVIYRAQNNTAMILQYVGSIEDQFNLEVIATDISIDLVETYIKHMIYSRPFVLEGYDKAQGEEIRAEDIKGINLYNCEIRADKLDYNNTTTYAMQSDGWKGEID